MFAAAGIGSGMEIVDLGRTSFEEADRVQKEALEAGVDRIVACELEPVITLGRGTRDGAVVEARFPIREVERGGEATLHLPGQLVLYPVVRLGPTARDLHRWLRRLEGVAILALGDFGVEGLRREGLTGVWTGAGKIVSLGIAVRRWHSYHGLSLNVDPDLGAFASIRPCGLDPAAMTSMARVLGRAPPFEDVKRRAIARLLEEIDPCPTPSPP